MLHKHSTMYSTARKVSFAVGLPIGLAVILLWGPIAVLRGPGDTSLETALTARPILPLIGALILGLWLASKKLPEHLLTNGFSLLTTSFFFSLYINGICWVTYAFAMAFPIFWLTEPIAILAHTSMWFNCSVLLTTFTVGLLISWITDKIMSSDSKKPIGYYDFD